ncbi:HAD-like domain-containing protein [Bisporella sp. PMI_857]|nr:HAD-like domain-containing protein [Bisporella sp. PMI_857]
MASQKTINLPKQVHTPGKNFGFSFDIDGVIHRSNELCPGAQEAMQYLRTNNIPFIFLTNGGGDPEDVRAKEMAEMLGIPVHQDQFIQAHTPFKQYLPELADKVVLVLGGVGNKCREVAEFYGYKNAITSADMIEGYPDLYPFKEAHGDYFRKTARRLPTTKNGDGSEELLPVSAIFLYSSPRDWGLDLQIILDLLLSEQGKFGTRSLLNNNHNLPNMGYLQDGQPKIYYANPDKVFATKWAHPRICQGSFKVALESTFSELTGGAKLTSGEHYIQVGKPTQLQYEYGERALRETSGQDLTQVYMVGDGPSSDIAGANNYRSPHGSTWNSILVQTGIHQAGTTPAYKPTQEVETVLDAVRWALQREGIEM